MSRDTRNNTTALAVILIITGVLVGCYACSESKQTRTTHAEPLPIVPPCGQQTADRTGIESWGPEWPPCPHKAMLAQSYANGR